MILMRGFKIILLVFSSRSKILSFLLTPTKDNNTSPTTITTTMMLPLVHLLIVAILRLSPTSALSVSSTSPPARQAAAAQQLVANWCSISNHLQNPELYDAEWANACHYDPNSNLLTTSRDVQRGEILSLLPIHDIGLTQGDDDNDDDDWIAIAFGGDDHQDTEELSSRNDDDDDAQNVPEKLLIQKSTDSKAGTVYRYDVSDFPEVPQTTQHTVPMDILNAMYCSVHHSHRPILQNGWMGHLAGAAGAADAGAAEQQTVADDATTTTTTTMPVAPLFLGNCCVLAIAPPLCALFATQDMPAGMPLILDNNNNSNNNNNKNQEQKDDTAEFFFNYREEIEALQAYMEMAYPKEEEEEDPTRNLPRQEDNANANDNDYNADFKFPFYKLPRNYPNLKVLHSDPDVFAIPNFLTDAECDSLIAKAKPHLVPCLTKNPTTGLVEVDPSRTSENTNIPQSEVPSIVSKLTRLGNCTADHLEILQVLHYQPGQFFEPHTDGFTGPVTACGFYDSARLVTIFCYLNDVEEGGATRFGDLDIDVEPQRGMAVVHFPTTLGFEEDVRTQHEGTMAVDDKWLLVTWVWMHPREQRSIYAEKWLDPLDDERI